MSTTHAESTGNDGAKVERRDEILTAARAAIEEHGPGALTGQIAQRAGLARPNVYRHFSSKDDLDLALARWAYMELRAAIRSRLDRSGSPLDLVRAPVEAQVNWAEKHPNLYRFLVSRGHQRSTEGIRTAKRSDFAAELAEAGARYFPGFADDAEAAEANMVGIIGLVDASVLRWLDNRGTRRGKASGKLAIIDRLTAQCWLLIDHHLHERGIHINPTQHLPSPRTAAPTSG
jgi:AcrR family transcriptional regulator